MNKEELLKILLQESDDPEGHHNECDEALLEFINDKEVTEAFESRTKWYA